MLWLSPEELQAAHERLRQDGWVILPKRPIMERDGLLGAVEPAFEVDPRAPLKQHARDVVHYKMRPHRQPWLEEASSIAHGHIDDFSRTPFLDYAPHVVQDFLALIPPDRLREHGRMSIDFFRYSPGVEVGPHQDQFGRYIFIYPLAYDATGGESVLYCGSQRVVDRVLDPGEVLVFEDPQFFHGVRLLRGTRDVLILIELND